MTDQRRGTDVTCTFYFRPDLNFAMVERYMLSLPLGVYTSLLQFSRTSVKVVDSIVRVRHQSQKYGIGLENKTE